MVCRYPAIAHTRVLLDAHASAIDVRVRLPKLPQTEGLGVVTGSSHSRISPEEARTSKEAVNALAFMGCTSKAFYAREDPLLSPYVIVAA